MENIFSLQVIKLVMTPAGWKVAAAQVPPQKKGIYIHFVNDEKLGVVPLRIGRAKGQNGIKGRWFIDSGSHQQAFFAELFDDQRYIDEYPNYARFFSHIRINFQTTKLMIVSVPDNLIDSVEMALILKFRPIWEVAYKGRKYRPDVNIVEQAQRWSADTKLEKLANEASFCQKVEEHLASLYDEGYRIEIMLTADNHQWLQNSKESDYNRIINNAITQLRRRISPPDKSVKGVRRLSTLNAVSSDFIGVFESFGLIKDKSKAKRQNILLRLRNSEKRIIYDFNPATGKGYIRFALSHEKIMRRDGYLDVFTHQYGDRAFNIKELTTVQLHELLEYYIALLKRQD